VDQKSRFPHTDFGKERRRKSLQILQEREGGGKGKKRDFSVPLSYRRKRALQKKKTKKTAPQKNHKREDMNRKPRSRRWFRSECASPRWVPGLKSTYLRANPTKRTTNPLIRGGMETALPPEEKKREKESEVIRYRTEKGKGAAL